VRSASGRPTPASRWDAADARVPEDIHAEVSRAIPAVQRSHRSSVSRRVGHRSLKHGEILVIAADADDH